MYKTENCDAAPLIKLNLPAKAKSMSRSEHPTREQILRAAEPLFAEHGFAGVTMRGIAKAAGVHLGQLPYHFGTKDALYRAIWEHWVSQIEARALLAEMQHGNDASRKAKLRGVVIAFFEGPGRMLRDPRGKHFVAIMVREVHDPASVSRSLLADFILPNAKIFRDELASLFPDMADEARDAGFEMIISALRIVIERGRPAEAGQLDPVQSTRMFALLTQFVVEGWMALADANYQKVN